MQFSSHGRNYFLFSNRSRKVRSVYARRSNFSNFHQLCADTRNSMRKFRSLRKFFEAGQPASSPPRECTLYATLSEAVRRVFQGVREKEKREPFWKSAAKTPSCSLQRERKRFFFPISFRPFCVKRVYTHTHIESEKAEERLHSAARTWKKGKNACTKNEL